MRSATRPSVLRHRLAAPAIGLLLLCGGAMCEDDNTQEGNTPVVHASQGDLVGLWKKSETGTKFMAFYGIPYAKPPIGDLRFKAPQPGDKWDGVFAAHTEGNVCPQPMKFMKRFGSTAKRMMGMATKLGALPNVGRFAAKIMTHMDENCLFLNVYTPLEVLPPDKLLPVLVFIHGGAFMVGSADSMIYGPEYLMDKEIVLVTLNYRLGPLGFLGTNTSDAPGNAGMKDQRLAMRWVQENIQAFGGDPAKVTIYGESAGSYSVHVHVLSPGSKGLFRSAIMSSSMGTNAYGFQADPAGVSIQLAEALGLDAESVADPAKRVEFLRGVPFKLMYSKMISSMNNKNLRSTTFTFPYAVVAEPPGTEDPFLIRSPIDILREGDYTRVPMVIGLNSMEGSLVLPLATDEELKNFAEHPTMFVPSQMQAKLDEAGQQALAKKIVDNYFKGKPIGVETLPEIVELFGDGALNHGVHVSTAWHTKQATAEAPVFRYFFSLSAFGAISFLLGLGKEMKGAGHADDLGYVFKTNLLSGLEIPEKDKVEKGRARMTELISNFVKEGNPTPTKTANVDVVWLPSTPGSEHYLEIGDELVPKEGEFFKERMEFWDSTFKEVIQDPIYDV